MVESCKYRPICWVSWPRRFGSLWNDEIKFYKKTGESQFWNENLTSDYNGKYMEPGQRNGAINVQFSTNKSRSYIVDESIPYFL
jgi:hypothetical protein